jgi:hypothetical protein
MIFETSIYFTLHPLAKAYSVCQLTQERSTEAQAEVKGHLDSKTNLVSGLEWDVLEFTGSKNGKLIKLVRTGMASIMLYMLIWKNHDAYAWQ